MGQERSDLPPAEAHQRSTAGARLFNLSRRAVRCRVLLLSWLRTIRFRLYLAFGLGASMTVVGSSFALYVMANHAATMTEIVSQSMPATVESLRLSEEASSLVASASRLVAAEDDSRRNKVAGDVAAQARVLNARIERLRALGVQNDGIEVAAASVSYRLDALDRAVADRIRTSARRRALVLAVRKYHESLIETITSVIDDANSELMTKGWAVDDKGALNRSVDSLRRLLQVQGQVSLLAGLLIEASMVTDVADLPPIRDRIAAAQRDIEANFGALPRSDRLNDIRNLYRRLASVAGDRGVLAQSISEINRDRDTQRVFSLALADAATLRTDVEHLIRRQGAVTRALSARADWQIRAVRVLLSVLSVAALGGAVLIAWLYVGRNIVGRLTLLSNAMRRLAAGDLSTPVTVGGRDEIAGMTQALLVFRKAIEDATGARERDAARAQDADLRRRRLEAAMQNFENAVNDVVQALDGASQSMEECAQIMAEAAGQNRTQAAATATASEEATTNVGKVAMAADEIARSVEQISAQARASAGIARQATGQAKAIIDTVENLVSSIGQINNVSNLIRGVAAQTNLLALNATIEAARAGQAGRGFAVVAQEVKALAAQTEKATGEITQQIASIELKTSKVVEAMKAIAATIGQLDENATDISAAVQQQDKVSKEIARSASAAAERTREVAARVAHASDAATRAGELANAVLSAGLGFAARSDKLRAEVERFLVQVRVV